MSKSTEMVDICPLSALSPERGVAALLPDGTQIALFLLDDGSVHAVQQHDPYCGANVLSRGLVGSHEIPAEGDEPSRIVPTLASPMYKQAWNLDSGEVLDAGGGEEIALDVFDTEIRDGHVFVAPVPRGAQR